MIDRRRIALTIGALMLAGGLVWLCRTPGDRDQAVSSDTIQVVSAKPAADGHIRAATGEATGTAPGLDRGFDPVSGGTNASSGSPNAEAEPPDPTLYSDDEPWGNAVYTIDGVVQPPRPGRIVPREQDVPFPPR